MNFEVVRYICQTRTREADDLESLESRRLRLLRPSQHWPLQLAGNIREVHRVIADEWLVFLLRAKTKAIQDKENS